MPQTSLVLIDQAALEACGGVLPHGYQDKVYKRGESRGLPKPFWEVDGIKFERLWKLIYPYIAKSVNRSAYWVTDSLEKEDILEDIKIWFFKVLFNYGPQPCGKPFHKQVPLTTQNALTNFKKRERQPSKSINYRTISLFFSIASKDPDATTLVELLASDVSIRERELVDLIATLPPYKRTVVVHYLENCSVSRTCRKFGISKNRLKLILRSCVV
jgi:DNA-directed RNA polymerase specialized sigma24 family protein